MIPQTERLDEDGQVEPPGFQLAILPFADDMRQIVDKFFNRETATEAQTAAAEDLIESCSIPPFNATLFSNPKLAKFYSCLQALALNKDDIEWNEEEDDNVYGDAEGMVEYAAAPARAFAEMLPAATEKVAKASSKKRKAAPEKIDPAVVKQMKFDFTEYRSAGTLKKQSVSILKAFCKAQGLSATGKKADLLKRVEDALDAESSSSSASK
jgi:ATP-dependent DNA helicase 2 subunit 1